MYQHLKGSNQTKYIYNLTFPITHCHCHLSGPGHHHLFAVKASRLPSKLPPWPFSLYSTSSWIVSHLLSHPPMTSHFIRTKALQTAFRGPLLPFLPHSVRLHLQLLSSLPVALQPDQPPGCSWARQACSCLWAFVLAVLLTWKGLHFSVPLPPFFHQLQVFSQKPSSRWGFLSLFYLTLQCSLTSYSSFRLNFSP